MVSGWQIVDSCSLPSRARQHKTAGLLGGSIRSASKENYDSPWKCGDAGTALVARWALHLNLLCGHQKGDASGTEHGEVVRVGDGNLVAVSQLVARQQIRIFRRSGSRRP